MYAAESRAAGHRPLVAAPCLPAVLEVLGHDDGCPRYDLLESVPACWLESRERHGGRWTALVVPRAGRTEDAARIETLRISAEGCHEPEVRLL